MNIVDQNIHEISALCEEHKVDKLFLFGSILTDRFGPGSDIDFLVEFGAVELMEYFENYFNFKHQLEKVINDRQN